MCIGLIASTGGRTYGPDWFRPLLRGLKPLVIPSGLIMLLIIFFLAVRAEGETKIQLTEFVLSGFAFSYLWMMSALLFDLVFVWHRYIRHARIHMLLRAARVIARQRRTESEEALRL